MCVKYCTVHLVSKPVITETKNDDDIGKDTIMKNMTERTVFELILVVFALGIGALSFATIRRKLKSPEKSFTNSAINSLLAIPRFMGLGPFKYGEDRSLRALAKYAIMTTRLNDFGGEEFFDDYEEVFK